MMNLLKCWLLTIGCVLLVAVPSHGQPPAAKEVADPVEIRGDRGLVESEKLNTIWLYPEDYVGQKLKLQGFIFEAENFEYFPDLNGYLFSCEPVIYGRNNAFHSHVGNATFLSREKLNFFCSTADGQRIRQLFKQRPGEAAIPASVTIEIRQRNGCYFGDLISFSPRRESE